MKLPKLIGSKTEEDLRAQLLASHESLFRDSARNRLLTCLRRCFPLIRTAYVLNWTPEQGEDIFLILVNDSLVAVIELDRQDLDSEAIVNSMSLSDYHRGLSKNGRINLA